MTLLQNAAMQKTLCMVKGSSSRKTNAITAVEDVDTFAKAGAGRFLARTMCDPSRAGIGKVDEEIMGRGQLSLGGDCWREPIKVIVLGPPKTSSLAVGENAIREQGRGRLVVYTDISGDNDGRVGGGWHAQRNGAGSIAVGDIPTVWDGEVAGIRQALMIAPKVDILVLRDSTAALQAVTRFACRGHGRSMDLVEVVDQIGRHSTVGLSTPLGLVKAHVGIEGNELVDLMGKARCRKSYSLRHCNA